MTSGTPLFHCPGSVNGKIGLCYGVESCFEELGLKNEQSLITYKYYFAVSSSLRLQVSWITSTYYRNEVYLILSARL